ncbi:PREDICTED: EF-hand calcium-binding domain-containing protein 9 [Tinamus guttatus]|nr:PREDICTED: EF-hand calcium-binding domain-containing protein 9 [Tinamus guttatus]
MKLKPGCFLQYLYLDETYCLLSVRNAKVLTDYFQLLDVHKKNALNNLQFYCFLHYVTDLKKKHIMLLFDLLDRNAEGSIGFDEFYLVVCLLLAHENHLEKQFIYRHSGPVFRLLDVDDDHTISPTEFRAAGFLFNIKKDELEKIFKDFDVSGEEKLSYKEFKMFTIFCIDKEQKREKERMRMGVTKGRTDITLPPESTSPQRTKHHHTYFQPGTSQPHFSIPTGSA